MPEVTITLRTIDESTKVVDKTKKEYESLFPAVEKAGKGLTEFVGRNATVIAAVVGTGVALKKAFDEWQKYAQEVRDVALASGTTATEASKLLQVLDDYQISAQDVTAATRAMTKEGLTPTIDTLAQLSDEYLEITDAQERNEFVIKKLGRAGLQWVNVLNQGGDAIREQSEGVSEWLILSDEQIKKAEQQRLAIDSLSDTWQGFKVQVGAAVGQLILNNQEQEKVYDLMRAQGKEVSATTYMTKEYADALEVVRASQENSGMDDYGMRLKEVGKITEEVAEETEDLGSNFEELISLTENIADETKNYNSQQQELRSKQAALKKEIDGLIKQGWTPMNQKVKDLQAEYDELGKESTELSKEHEQAMKQMQYDLIATKLASGGLTEAEYDLQIQVGETLGVFDKSSANAARAMNKVTQAVVDGKLRTQDLDRALKLMEEYDYNIDVVLDVIASYSNFNVQTGGDTVGSGDISVATGGWLGGGWSLVGDMPGGQLAPYSELISPNGYVFDAKTSRKLLASGILGDIDSHAEANEDGGGVFHGTLRPPSIPASRPRARVRERPRSSRASISDVAEPDTSAAMDTAEEMRAVSVEMRQEFQRASAANVSAINNKMDELISVMTGDNPRLISKGVGFELSKVVG